MLTIEELKQDLRPLLNAPEKPGDSVAAPWFEALALRLEDGRLVVGFPHSYFGRWFRQHKQAGFEKALARLSLPIESLIYEDAALVRAPGQGDLSAGPAASAAANPTRNFGAEGLSVCANADSCSGPDPDFGPNLDKDEFEDFIVNAKNAFPLATARKIACEEPPAGGIAVFCGKSGTGKTKLLQAMHVALVQRLGRQRVHMNLASRFCAEISESAPACENFWLGCQALLLDDVQDIADQTRWQRSLALCLDARPGQVLAEGGSGAAGRLVVLAHVGPARALAQLEERLRGRLLSGLVLELLEPDLDVRLRYLQRAARERQLALTREQLLYLAQRCGQFSLLQGLVRKVEAFAALHGQPPLQADLENIVRTGGSARPVGCREILGSVARGFNLRAEDILGARRRPDFVLARQVAMYICRRKLGLSYPELGRAFGGRDHSTVIHAVKKIRKLLDTDKVVHTLVTELENTVP